MSNLMTKPCLLLNASYQAISVCSTKRAVKLMMKGVAEQLEGYDNTVIYSSRMWDEVSGEHIDVKMSLPSVVKLIRYRNIPMRIQVMSRKNIYIRDQFCCGYCQKSCTYNELTLDHIIPQSKGGKNTWDNLVSCCLICNRKKGDKFLHELTDMKLYRGIPKPATVHTSREILRNMGKSDIKWQKYLYFENTTPQTYD